MRLYFYLLILVAAPANAASDMAFLHEAVIKLCGSENMNQCLGFNRQRCELVMQGAFQECDTKIPDTPDEANFNKWIQCVKHYYWPRLKLTDARLEACSGKHSASK